MTSGSADTLFRPDLLAKYGANGPRYTSYPTALQFRDDFPHSEFVCVKLCKRVDQVFG